MALRAAPADHLVKIRSPAIGERFEQIRGTVRSRTLVAKGAAGKLKALAQLI